MRTFLIAAAAAMTVGLTSAAPAQATYWSCQGGYVACGGGESSTKSYSKKSSHKAAASSYGDDGYVPMKKKTRKASYNVASDDDDQPRRSKRRSRVTNSGSGYSAGGGMASYYWQPQRVASGGWFNPNALTAAHKTLPFGTRVRVTHLKSGQSVEVRINDRNGGREVIDLSKAAAAKIGLVREGRAQVRLDVL